MLADNVPVSPYTGIKGWESNQEQGALIALATGVPAGGVILEIGSEYGMSASIWAKHSKASKIYCVEMNPDAPFLYNIGEKGLIPIEEMNARFKWLNQDSRFVDLDAELEGDKQLDLLFIDGDHSYEGAYDDLAHYSPYVKIGGFMAVHDVACATNKDPHPLHYAVNTAIHHWLTGIGQEDALKRPREKGWQFLFTVDSLMVFRRGEK